MHSRNNTIHKCIIVDDEPMARDVVRRYVEQVPNLELVSEFGNAIAANLYLQENTVDLIFLDIRMPQLNGTDFVRSLPTVPRIIFTTAHKEYAHEGFDLDVVDYLLKPIRFDRFLKAVNKAFPRKDPEIANEPIPTLAENKPAQSFIYVRVDRKMMKVVLDDILYIESERDYVKLYTSKGYILTRQTIASIEAMLSEKQFTRIHRSFIVSVSKVKSFTHETVEVDNKELPIGKLYRNSFLKLVGS